MVFTNQWWSDAIRDAWCKCTSCPPRAPDICNVMIPRKWYFRSTASTFLIISCFATTFLAGLSQHCRRPGSSKTQRSAAIQHCRSRRNVHVRCSNLSLRPLPFPLPWPFGDLFLELDCFLNSVIISGGVPFEGTHLPMTKRTTPIGCCHLLQFLEGF